MRTSCLAIQVAVFTERLREGGASQFREGVRLRGRPRKTPAIAGDFSPGIRLRAEAGDRSWGQKRAATLPRRRVETRTLPLRLP